MSIYDHMLLITSFITVSTCHPYLVIIWKDHNDVIPHTIVAPVGSNLSLTCKLEGIQDFDTNLVWGRRTHELKFGNAADLKELAMNNSKQILDVRDQYNPLATDTAIKTFVPLKLTDQGAYFCMNWKYKLFKIVRIKVDEGIICAHDQFKCDDGKKCIHESATCNNEFDCTDHSDERWPRCPCVGFLCEDECIPMKWCCDINIDLDCFIPNRHRCCPPLAVGSDNESYEKNDTETSTYSIRVHTVVLFVVGAAVFVVLCAVLYHGVKEWKANGEASDCNNQNGIPVPIIRTNDNDNTMILTALMNTGRMDDFREYLDLPPTYHDSTRNSPQSSFHNSLEDIPETVINDCSLPPSYNEALDKLTSLINEDGTTSDFLEVPSQNMTSRDRT